MCILYIYINKFLAHVHVGFMLSDTEVLPMGSFNWGLYRGAHVEGWSGGKTRRYGSFPK